MAKKHWKETGAILYAVTRLYSGKHECHIEVIGNPKDGYKVFANAFSTQGGNGIIDEGQSFFDDYEIAIEFCERILIPRLMKKYGVMRKEVESDKSKS